MKLIAADRIGSDPDVRAAAIARFEREARITASLRSRSTIDLWDFGTAADGTWYYVMELLDGMDLRQLVGRHGPLPAGRIVHLLVQACASLGEAHDRGLVHRDIKPENLFACRLADEVDVLKVLDFGIVAEPQPAAGAAITRAGYINGTPGYMAPEQARARPLDGRADLYALGCVAYWLACGCDVFDGEPYELIAHQLSTAPTPPSRFVRDLPPGLEQLILDCLAKDPGQRPQNARVLAQRLRALDIPADAAWPPETAQAWWTAHLPPGGAA
jgi:serine/threonine-protein kinase